MMRVGWLLMFPPLLASPAFAADPATAPSTRPSDAVIAVWFADLSSDDPAIRDAARINLMGLTRADLPALKQQAMRNLPLNAAQLGMLRQIVIHVYLAGQDVPAPENSGFMGVSFGYDADETVRERGVVVNDRIPGFTAFQMLQNGDIIVSVRIGEERAVRNRTELSAIVGNLTPGDVVQLKIIRSGRELLVPLRLNPRPLWAGDLVGDEQTQRLLTAEEYWESTFASELDPSIG